eukprot:11205395-Lingulodinium_polyedra.AAC.1
MDGRLLTVTIDAAITPLKIVAIYAPHYGRYLGEREGARGGRGLLHGRLHGPHPHKRLRRATDVA